MTIAAVVMPMATAEHQRYVQAAIRTIITRQPIRTIPVSGSQMIVLPVIPRDPAGVRQLFPHTVIIMYSKAPMPALETTVPPATTGITRTHLPLAPVAILMDTTRPTILHIHPHSSRQPVMIAIHRPPGPRRILTMTGSISLFIQENTRANGINVLIVIPIPGITPL